MIGIFAMLIKASMELGEINQALMYESGFMSIEGRAKDGRKFTLSLTKEAAKEEETNGN